MGIRRVGEWLLCDVNPCLLASVFCGSAIDMLLHATEAVLSHFTLPRPPPGGGDTGPERVDLRGSLVLHFRGIEVM